ncbi:MAG: methyltransferase domain-containing protein [Gammaproteobacteria bacterium]
MDKATLASVEVALRWCSPHAGHTDRRVFDRVNFWRDLFPADMGERLSVAEAGTSVSRSVAAGELVAGYNSALVRRVPTSRFNTRPRPDLTLAPRVGRFYPLNLLSEVPGFYPQDRRPFRVLDADDGVLTVDINHPFARFPATMDARVMEFLNVKEERGGRCNDIGQEMTEYGPGLQAALPDRDTDFYSGEPFARLDPRADEQFYARARLVQHIDATARAGIGAIYERCLQPGMAVLDLMSSWISHLPESVADLEVTGLGMNREELERNPRLAHHVVHDLNADPHLPFDDKRFDAAVCTVSVEYLTRPLDVFEQLARVLRPGGVFVVTFSERWFPTKVIELWTQLHPFERLGLVLDYFRRAGFVDLGTESVRGLPRPADDPYADRLAHSDPVYAVWGRAPA